MSFPSSTRSTIVASFLLIVAGCGSTADGDPPPQPEAAPPVPALPSDTPVIAHEPPAVCDQASAVYAATREPSNVLFLLDRSGSMHIELPSGQTRWSAMKAGLFDLLSVLPATTQVGAMMFPQGDAPVNAYCGIDPNANDVSCKRGWPEPSEALRCDASTYKAGVPNALLSPAHRQAIEAHVASSDAEFYWGTPLASALLAAIGAQKSSPLAGSRSVILLTDGNPTSCGDSGVSNDIENVVAAAATGLSGTLVRTFVIGVVDGARQAAKAENLSPIAIAAGTKRFAGCEATNECFYPVTQASFAADLEKVFEEISLQAFDCTFNLPPASAGTDPSKINVSITDGSGSRAIGRDSGHQNGWDYLPNGTQIQLFGQACTDMKAGNGRLDVVLGCKTIVAEPPASPR